MGEATKARSRLSGPRIWTVFLVTATLAACNLYGPLNNPFDPKATVFAPGQQFSIGSYVASMATADVNGDGRPDLLLADGGYVSYASVFLNQTTVGASKVSFASAEKFNIGYYVATVATADINSDGKPDFVVTNRSTNTVSVLLNTTPTGSSTASFATPLSLPVASSPGEVLTADINGDGKPDIVVSNDSSDTVTILLNTTPVGGTTASFSPAQTFAVGTTPEAVAVADLNSDGKPDIIVANKGSNNVSVLMNNTPQGATSASFLSAQTFAVGTAPVSLGVGDLNGDTLPDLVVANANSNTISILVNTTASGAMTASFDNPKSISVNASPAGLSVADLNADVKPDIVVASRTDNTVSILMNTTVVGASIPSFTTLAALNTGSDPIFTAIADVNNDGKPDIIVANNGDATATVYLNELP